MTEINNCLELNLWQTLKENVAESATGLTEAFDVVIDLLQDPDILQSGVARWCGRGCGMGGRWLGLIRDR